MKFRQKLQYLQVNSTGLNTITRNVLTIFLVCLEVYVLWYQLFVNASINEFYRL